MSTKHMRLPNGFGQISYLKNRRLRNPWRAMVTVGKTPEGRPICAILKPYGYFKSYNDAYTALVEYHRNPYDAESDITMQELYEKWSEQHFKELANMSTSRAIKSAWNYSSTIADMKVKDVRIRHLRACIEEAEYRGKVATPTIKKNMKSNFNCMFDLAVELEITDHNYARQFTLKGNKKNIEKNKKPHVAFTDEEVKILWENMLVPFADIVLIQCYSGWRPKELGDLLLENIDLVNYTFTGGSKTEAGENRTVPIHTAIIPLVEKRYREALAVGSPYLLNCIDNITKRDDTRFDYDRMRPRFADMLKTLGLNEDHKLHDGRKTFTTLCKNADVNEYAIKRMVGHHIGDITEKVYTDRPKEWLRLEIEKIKKPM